jgi:hypothetical protein
MGPIPPKATMSTAAAGGSVRETGLSKLNSSARSDRKFAECHKDRPEGRIDLGVVP